MDHIVLGVEIKKTIEEAGGWDHTELLGVAVACVWEHATGRMRTYGDTDADLLALRARMEAADRITGFNIWKFDFPVIYGLPGRDRVEHLRAKTDDLLVRIWQALGLNPYGFSRLHGGWGLDVVAGATLGHRKIGNGADAPVWYQEGRWGEVVNYCADDVALERDLGMFIDRYGFVIGKEEQVVRLASDWRLPPNK